MSEHLHRKIGQTAVDWVFKKGIMGKVPCSEIASELCRSIEHLWGIWSTGLAHMPDDVIKKMFDETNETIWKIVIKDLNSMRTEVKTNE